MTALDAEMRIDLALSQGIRIDNKLIDLAYYLEINRFKNRYLALNDLQKPNIIAVYISSSETYDIVRGIVDNDNSSTVQE